MPGARYLRLLRTSISRDSSFDQAKKIRWRNFKSKAELEQNRHARAVPSEFKEAYVIAVNFAFERERFLRPQSPLSLFTKHYPKRLQYIDIATIQSAAQ